MNNIGYISQIIGPVVDVHFDAASDEKRLRSAGFGIEAFPQRKKQLVGLSFFHPGDEACAFTHYFVVEDNSVRKGIAYGDRTSEVISVEPYLDELPAPDRDLGIGPKNDPEGVPGDGSVAPDGESHFPHIVTKMDSLQAVP